MLTDRKTLCLILTVFLGGVLALDPFATIRDPITGTFTDDKTRHILTFALLILPTGILWPRALPAGAIALLACGALAELIQPVFGRESSFADMMANVVGVALGVLIGAVLRKLAGRP